MKNTLETRSLVSALAVLVALIGAGTLSAEVSGWQIDLKYGESDLSEAFGPPGSGSFDDDSTSSSIELGYRFNEYFGLQAGYHDLGSYDGSGGFGCAPGDAPCIERLAQTGLCVEGTSCLFAPVPLEAEITGWSLAAVPSWPFTERLSAYGKLGFLGWDNDVSATAVIPGLARLASYSDTDLLTAVGVRYRFGQNVGALLEYQRLDLDLESSSLGISWSF